MGALTESSIVNQLKKGQGETNERLDRIAALLEQQNQWLAALYQLQQAR